MPDYHKISINFEEYFDEYILQAQVEEKLNKKHDVYLEDVEDAFGDPYIIIARPKQKSPLPKNKEKSEGIPCDIYAETSSKRVLFIFAWLFDNRKMYIISAYWANEKWKSFILNSVRKYMERSR